MIILGAWVSVVAGIHCNDYSVNFIQETGWPVVLMIQNVSSGI